MHYNHITVMTFARSPSPRYQSDEIALATHTGTHLDAPVHFGGKNKWRVADIPLRNLVEKPLSLVDIVEQSQSTRDYLATVDDLKQWEEVNGEIPEDSVLILRTGWSNFWPNKLDYFGTDSKNPSLAHFPGLSPEAARWLVEHRKVVGVGIDGPSIDCGQCDTKQAHVTLNEANVFILENIDRSIFKVPNVGATITVLPLKLTDASGSPVRAIAQYSHQHADTNWAVSGHRPSHLLLALSALLVAARLTA